MGAVPVVYRVPGLITDHTILLSGLIIYFD